MAHLAASGSGAKDKVNSVNRQRATALMLLLMCGVIPQPATTRPLVSSCCSTSNSLVAYALSSGTGRSASSAASRCS